MQHFLQHLNPQQAEAVALPVGPALILAGPGSGKTRVLTHRAAYLVHALGIPRRHILAVTFTNKAANEMKTRVQALLHKDLDQAQVRAGQYGDHMSVGTFHAICARILRIEYAYTPYERNWVILDRQDQDQLVKELLKEADAGDLSPYALIQRISHFKNNCHTPDMLEPSPWHSEERQIHQLYTAYQQRLLESNAMDFDDLLLQTHLLFATHEAVLAKYRRRWRHILVDEFQDTNWVQYRLLRRLVRYPESPQHLFAVGDEDQSIYAFRGADYKNLQRFRHDFARARTILLEQNYRSTPEILAAANGLIARNPARAPKHLFTERTPGQQVVLCETPDAQTEAEWIGRSVASLLEETDYGPEDVAIMYRTNAQSRPIEEALLHHGIAYRLIGALRFYDRMEIKDALAYLRVIVNPRDTLSLLRILNRPTRGIGSATQQRLRTCSQQWQLSLADTLTLVCRGPEAVPDAEPHLLQAYPSPFQGRALQALQNFEHMLQGWRTALDTEEKFSDPGLFLHHVCASSGYLRFLEASREDRARRTDRLENLHELMATASQPLPALQEQELALTPLELFLVHASLVASHDALEDGETRITLMTLHMAKGLEFPAVYIAGLDEDLIPHYRSIAQGSDREMEEERRILYVGLTRAMDMLFLTRADSRIRAYGSSYPCRPSRFLQEIPEAALYRERYAGSRHSRWHYARPAPARAPSRPAARQVRRPQSIFPWHPEEDTGQTDAESQIQPRFRAAMVVRHPIFGRGTVLASQIKHGQEEVSVVFDEHGPKRLLAALANFTIVRD